MSLDISARENVSTIGMGIGQGYHWENIGICVILQVAPVELVRMMVICAIFKTCTMALVKILPWYSCHYHCCMYGTGATVVLVKILVWHWCHSLAPKILLEASGLSPAGARTMSRCATWDLHHNLFLLETNFIQSTWQHHLSLLLWNFQTDFVFLQILSDWELPFSLWPRSSLT